MIKGIGTDIIELSRIAEAIKKHQNFVQRVFTPHEIIYCRGKQQSTASFAARFAAKEAVSKAFGTGIGRIRWLDIEIYNDNQNKPCVRLSGRGAELAKSMSVRHIHLSLSHCKEYATAMVVLEG